MVPWLQTWLPCKSLGSPWRFREHCPTPSAHVPPQLCWRKGVSGTEDGVGVGFPHLSWRKYFPGLPSSLLIIAHSTITGSHAHLWSNHGERRMGLLCLALADDDSFTRVGSASPKHIVTGSPKNTGRLLSRERGGEDCEVSNQERPPPVAPVIMTICQTWTLRLKQVKNSAHGTCSLAIKEGSLPVTSVGSRFRDHFTTFNCKAIWNWELRAYALADRVRKAKKRNSVVHFVIQRHHIILQGEEHFSQWVLRGIYCMESKGSSNIMDKIRSNGWHMPCRYEEEAGVVVFF